MGFELGVIPSVHVLVGPKYDVRVRDPRSPERQDFGFFGCMVKYTVLENKRY